MATDPSTPERQKAWPASADHLRLIEISIREVKQLFNSMDPSPFNERDLDRDADEYIVNWAREYSLKSPLALRVHLEVWPADDPTPLITDAVHHYFAYRAGLSDLEFRRIMREGRTSLVIGLLFLGALLIASQLLIGRNPAAWAGYVRESLTIAGWVAMWKPMETYLYDWWPVRRRGKVFKKLSTMPVEVVHGKPA